MTSAQDEFSKGTKAVIYCRVSSSKQTKRGDGLGSQETRCREYARYKGCDVAKVFSDDMTGSLVTRPGMQAMLSFIRKHRGKEDVIVIIDDISRLARGIEAHLQLRTAIGEAGGTLKSPTIEFGEDSDSILVENLLASVSQHQRQKNGEQTINRMRARTMNGYWCFQAPIGYRYSRASSHGNLLVRDEPHASIIQEALEGFASGRFETQVEVKRFLESEPGYPKDAVTGLVHNQRVYDLLTRPIYAGYLEAPKWNVSLREGKHEGLISFATFEKIQDRLETGAKATARKDISADFPLRGFVLCGDCNKPLTACWSKSRTGKKHPYYLCPSKGCLSYRKSIRRDALETEFDELVATLQPAGQLFKIAKAMFKHAWNQRLAQTSVMIRTIEQDITKIEKQTEHLLDRIVDATNPSVVSAYETRIAKLERERLIAAEKLKAGSVPSNTFEEMFELALAFLSNPQKLWASGHLHFKRIVLRLAFSERIQYCRQTGLRTPKTSLPFNILGGINMSESKMARPEGFEPSASAFGGQRSIQLSYGRVEG